MKSEWEELEKMSKEELILENVRLKYKIQCILKALSELSGNGFEGYLWADGNVPSDQWKKRIEDDAVARLGADEVTEIDFQEYGVDEKTARKMFTDVTGIEIESDDGEQKDV